LEVVLVALRAGIEPEAGSRPELGTALGKASTIATSAVASSGIKVSVEIASATLTLLAKGAKGSGSSAFGPRIPGRRPSSHRGKTITSNGGDVSLSAPVEP
jgi:hypothetical protein